MKCLLSGFGSYDSLWVFVKICKSLMMFFDMFMIVFKTLMMVYEMFFGFVQDSYDGL